MWAGSGESSPHSLLLDLYSEEEETLKTEKEFQTIKIKKTILRRVSTLPKLETIFQKVKESG